MNFLRRYPELIILTLAALATRLWDLFQPASVVFDEVYFKVFAGDYLTGSYFFDIHPPLGKLLLAGWAWLLHLDPAMVTSTTAPTVALRLLPALAGALIIPVFYLFLRQLGASKRMATLGGALLLLDNALLVESRFILVDSLLLLFGLGAVTCFLAARNKAGRGRYLLLTASALLAGASASVKWTGLTALGLIGLIWLYDQIRHWRRTPHLRQAVELAMLLVIPFIIYFSSFWLHFHLLTRSGAGDAFMSQKFQSTLAGNAYYDPKARMSDWDKFIELNLEMNRSEDSLKTATHPYGSKWSSWPFMSRGIYYWQGPLLADGRQGNIYLLGNPVVWWGILAVIIVCVLATTATLKRLRPYRLALIILAVGYAANYMPFIGIVRVMFLYHYFFALIYSLAIAVILLGALGNWTDDGKHPWKFASPASRKLYIGILALAFIGFVYFAPLSYGTPLSPAGIAQHMWLPSWR